MCTGDVIDMIGKQQHPKMWVIHRHPKVNQRWALAPTMSDHMEPAVLSPTSCAKIALNCAHFGTMLLQKKSWRSLNGSPEDLRKMFPLSLNVSYSLYFSDIGDWNSLWKKRVSQMNKYVGFYQNSSLPAKFDQQTISSVLARNCSRCPQSSNQKMISNRIHFCMKIKSITHFDGYFKFGTLTRQLLHLYLLSIDL
jgi:hypothetical protein